MTSHRAASGGAGPGQGAWRQGPEDVPAEQGVPPAAGRWQPASAQGTQGPPAAGQPTAGQPTAGQPNAGQPNAAQPTAGQLPAAPVSAPAGHGQVRQHVIKRTRIGGAWLAFALFALVLLFLLIFILQNGNKVEISYLGLHGHLPLGVALLLAAVLGVVLVVIPGTGRILQLRATARRHRRIDAQAAADQAATAPTAPTAPTGVGPPDAATPDN
jgi:lipopolysaccharide assembly protein A